jgi:uncharacterized protein YejL (UPF0352 family)
LASLFAQRRNFVLHLSPLHTHLLSLLWSVKQPYDIFLIYFGNVLSNSLLTSNTRQKLVVWPNAQISRTILCLLREDSNSYTVTKLKARRTVKLLYARHVFQHFRSKHFLHGWQCSR